MRLQITPLPQEVSTELLKELVSADGRKIDDVFVPDRRGFGFVNADIENCQEILSALHGQSLCGLELRIQKARRRGRRRKYQRGTSSAAKKSDIQRTKLRSTSMGSKPMVSDVQGSRGIVHTKSRFQDPRRTVAKSIEEALDPTKAPKTIMEYYAPDPLDGVEIQGPGPETKKILDRLESDFGNKDRIRRAVKRAENRTKRVTSSHRGITSDFVQEDPETHSKEANTKLAVEFLRKWLSSGPRPGPDLILDAKRDGVPKNALSRALKTLGGHKTRRGKWSLEPKPRKRIAEKDKPFQKLLYTPQHYRLHDTDFVQMQSHSTEVPWAEVVENCNITCRQDCAFSEKFNVRKGNIFSKQCYFILRDSLSPLVWVRNPGGTLKNLIHVQYPLAIGGACIVKIRRFHREQVIAIDCGDFDRKSGLWMFETVSDAKLALGKLVRAWGVMRRKEAKEK